MQSLGIGPGITLADIGPLRSGFSLRNVPAGEILCRPDYSGRWLYVLLDGQVDLYRLSAGGKRLVTRRVLPGGVFGALALLAEAPQRCFAEATKASRVCCIAREAMLRMIELRPEVAMRLIRAVYNHLEALEKRLELASFGSVRERLAHFLLSNMDGAGIVMGFTQADIGDIIGALRQTVTEALSRLHGLGLVAVRPKRIAVLSTQGLEALAQGEGE